MSATMQLSTFFGLLYLSLFAVLTAALPPPTSIANFDLDSTTSSITYGAPEILETVVEARDSQAKGEWCNYLCGDDLCSCKYNPSQGQCCTGNGCRRKNCPRSLAKIGAALSESVSKTEEAVKKRDGTFEHVEQPEVESISTKTAHEWKICAYFCGARVCTCGFDPDFNQCCTWNGCRSGAQCPKNPRSLKG
ncbi:hypothetical protein BDV96DRAFT_572540 [Lophiotrema nucula]|uniref:Uncharacterized protein n=1 Tax=Lophiotrema nucula TaxID=690887 RepID=A0A6A5ZAW9_9PLEO|nr:hypothetical protein BDV96DRAFT_572540 [Lophiotrema nucula]